jgi:thioredoxin reductase
MLLDDECNNVVIIRDGGIRILAAYNTDLSRLCGCRHDYDPNLRVWQTTYDDRMETAVFGTFMAGDGTDLCPDECKILAD